MGTALTSAVLIATGALPAWAQEGATAARTRALEEIVVTAQKREENLAKVPVAVTVVGGEALSARGAITMENVQQLVPSLSFGKGGTNRNSNLSLRGVGTISFSVGAEPSVSTVIDGVVMARSGQAFVDLIDVQRIEVLRGPQGTLFGKNASSGVINIVSRGPEDEFGASADVTYAEDQEVILRGMVTGPIADNVKFRLNGFYGDMDGFIKNAFNGDTIYGYERWGGRAMVDFEPTERLKIRVIGDYSKTDDKCCSEVVIRDDGSLQAAAFTQGGGVIAGFDTRITASNALQRTQNQNYGGSIQIDYDFDAFTVTSISAYREWTNVERQDIDDTPFGSTERDGDDPANITLNSVDGVLVGLNTARDWGPQKWKQWSEEIRLTSTGSGPLQWQIGGFLWSSNVDRTFARYDALCVNDPNGLIGGVDISGLANGDPCPTSNIVLPSARADMTVDFDNYAAFGQATWNFTEDTGITVGARVTRDKVVNTHMRERVGDEFKDILGNQDGNPNNDGGVFALQVDKPLTTGTAKNTNFSVKAAIHHDFSEELMGYFSYAQGYKGPAFNVFFNMVDPNNLPAINPETSDAFEGGLKWELDSAVISIAVFRADYSNFQSNSFILTAGAVTTNLTNAGDVKTQGVEFEFVSQPTDNLSFYGGVTFADAEIKKFDCSLAQTIGAACSERTGEDLQFAPKVKGSFTAEYVVPATDDIDVIFNSNLSFQSESFSAEFENQNMRIPAYAITNASVAVSFMEDRYRATFFVRNLFDQEYPAAFNEGGRVARFPRDVDRYFGGNVRVRF